MAYDWTPPSPPSQSKDWGANRQTAEEATRRQAEIWNWAKAKLAEIRQQMKE